ncbi:MAG: SUF system NifU family Fe-S cluster assembly protein [Planctomycetota bacterium]|nr:SUF system NifU family Fe-S cluster assembly protein [Planctomycetota bacterium]MCZ6851646.1 SUF system NifU family Fe-S cluster assembly protein [Planctomycetota bacterium]
MSALTDLYQQLILDHNKSPRNRRKLEPSDGRAEGYNPLCGDRVTVYLSLDGDVVRDIAFEGSGCAISTAAASMMTQRLKGKSVSEAKSLFEKFHRLLTDEHGVGDGGPELGKLEAFGGVRRFPARVKCATLVWHTLNAALENSEDIVSTE